MAGVVGAAEGSDILLGWARRELSDAGIADSLFEARLILAHALGVERVELLRRGRFGVAPPLADRFRELVTRRAERVPMAYLTGRREFYGLEFVVTPDVLVPRPETELLVDLACEIAGEGRPELLVDVGTGSGCVAIACLLHGWRNALAVDLSQAALTVARANAAHHGVAASVGWVRGNLLRPIGAAVADMVVSNPPYIPTAEIGALQPEVRVFEPRLALDGGPDGLDAICSLVLEAHRVLKPGGMLATEVAAGQAPAVVAMLAEAGYGRIAVRRDLAGIDRVVSATSPDHARRLWCDGPPYPSDEIHG